MKRSGPWLGLLMLLVVFVTYNSAFGESLPEPSQIAQNQREVTYERLRSKASKEGSVRIIVGTKIDTEFSPEGELDHQRAEMQRNSISRAQQSLLNRLRSHNPRQIKTFDVIPYVAIEVDVNGLEAILADPEI